MISRGSFFSLKNALAFLLGSLILVILSIPQKIVIGADPFKIQGFIVPVLFGGFTGLVLGVFHNRLLRENLRLTKAHRDLRRMSLQYQSYFNNNHAVMLLIDPASGEIVDANPAACIYYGYDKDEIIRLRIADINTLPEDEVLREMELAESESRRHFRFKHRLADGEVREVEVYSGPVKYKDRKLLYSLIFDITERVRAENEREELIVRLQDALANIKTLSGLLPICSRCKKIRDDKGYWQQIEEYISSQSEARFSHGICPECMAKLYPDIDSE